MNILFVHQNFPSQYIHLIRELARDSRHCLVAFGIEKPDVPIPASVTFIRYPLRRANTPGIHPFALDFESKILRAEACASAAYELSKKGFVPDLICAHPGWGEILFLKEIWPDSPLILYHEFYYHTLGFDCRFDSEFEFGSTWQSRAKILVKNSSLLLSLEASDWNVTPTHFQKSSFPSYWQKRFSVIHDGIDTEFASPSSRPVNVRLPGGTALDSSMPVITFVNRRMEPYRGFHTFVRSIPRLQKLCPDAHIVIVGALSGVSYGGPCPDGEWSDYFLREIDGCYDPSLVHFVGPVSHQNLISLFRISSCHVYLTYPFVLSWSLLEAMSCGCAIVGSNTQPVQELIVDGRNGLLVDFFSPDQVAEAVSSLLTDQKFANSMGSKARELICSRYRIDQCVPRHLALMDLVASGSLPV